MTKKLPFCFNSHMCLLYEKLGSEIDTDYIFNFHTDEDSSKYIHAQENHFIEYSSLRKYLKPNTQP